MKNKHDNKKIYKEIAPFLNIGLQMAITIGGFVFLGWWLDKKFDTSPILILICIFVGFVISFYNFFRTINNNK